MDKILVLTKQESLIANEKVASPRSFLASSSASPGTSLNDSFHNLSANTNTPTIHFSKPSEKQRTPVAKTKGMSFLEGAKLNYFY